MKKIQNLVVDTRFAVCQQVLVALAARFQGLNFSNEKVGDPLSNDYVVKFYMVKDVDQQYYGAVRDYAEGFYDAIRERHAEKPAPVVVHRFKDLSAGDVFSFTTSSGLLSSIKYLKLSLHGGKERILNLATNRVIDQVENSHVWKDEDLTLKRKSWVENIRKTAETEFSKLEVGDVFYFPDSARSLYLKVAPLPGHSEWVQCIRLSTNEPCMCHKDAIVRLNNLATDENDAARIDLLAQE